MTQATQAVRRQLRLTHAGLWAERITRAFWPAWSAGFAALAVWAFDVGPSLWRGSLIAALLLLMLVTLVLGIRAFRRPTEAEAEARLDATLPGRPLTALTDDQVIGASDPASAAVWQAHRDRMAKRLSEARAVAPDLRVASRDPYALRYLAVLFAAIALLFGTVWRAPDLPILAEGGAAVPTGPTWEAWLEPPRHTGRPTLYLPDIDAGEVVVPRGTRVTLRLYGDGVPVTETVSGRDVIDPSQPMQEFEVRQSGTLSIGENGPVWTLTASPDTAPEIEMTGDAAFEHPDQVTLPWTATDDYGVVAASIRIALDAEGMDRPYGLAVEPEPRDPYETDMALPISGDRGMIEGMFRDVLVEHPLAGMPVTVTLTAEDGAGQDGTVSRTMVLPGRSFYDPVASALIEQRRDLNWARANQARVARVLRAVTWKGDETFDNPAAFLIVRMAIRRLSEGPLTMEARDEIAQMLWEAALRLEENSLDGALERLRQAQERLSEAIRQGASPDEIARLTAEMRQAMDDYTRQLAEQGQQNGEGQQQAQGGETQEITPDMLSEMMERIEELMRQGRTAEAQELLRQLQEMMENLQVTQGQGGGGQGQPGEGQQAMEELRDQLREQQELSDEAFRELQEQFGEGQDPGEGQQGQQGEQGQQGQGQAQGPEGQGGRGTQRGQQGEGQPGLSQEPGNPGSGPEGQQRADGGSLSRRQEMLRQGLSDLRDALPGAGSEAGDAARDALRRAEEAMREAERDLADGNLGGALDDQAQAMDAIRDGMEQLGRALAGDDRPPQEGGGNDQARGQPGQGAQRDPLGRRSGEGGEIGTGDPLLGGPEAARRARDLMEEIRRRSGERERPQLELDYLRRLLDRF